MTPRTVKGMRDILPPSSRIWNQVDRLAREIFRTFNYQEIRTPILEETALFARGVGAETDIVGKEMYTFEDRDGSSLTLRPEATASVMRSYIEHRMDQLPGVKKLYYMGPMFRRERQQKGRYRQFYQIGGEAIGSESPTIDAEVIEMSVEILRRCGLTGFQVLINSVGCSICRPAFVELLKQKLAEVAPQMCEDCQRRAVTNPLRVLDCKVPEDQPIIETLPSILDHLNPECAEHFASVRSILDSRGIGYEVRPRLVRGLDYYQHTVFEFTTEALGSQGTVLAGGRYDGLVKLMGGPDLPGVGFAAGIERLLALVEVIMKDPVGYVHPTQPLAVIPIEDAQEIEALKLASELRHQDFTVELITRGNMSKKMKRAARFNASAALMLGESEVRTSKVTVKNMADGSQQEMMRDELVAYLRQKGLGA